MFQNILLSFAGLLLAPNLSAQDISRNVNDIKFYYYPSVNDRREITYGNVDSLIRSNLQDRASTVLIIDGFLSDGSSQMSQTLKNAFLSRGSDQNIIVVDWGRLSGSGQTLGNVVRTAGTYLRVLQNVDPIAYRVAEFLNFLRYHKHIPFSDVHICSHSLGAHIAGHAGAYIQKYFRGNLGRITGLDPAGPFFSFGVRQDRKLTKGDASFVDIYHTNRRSLGSRELRTGDINVYVNGGNDNQPGCSEADSNGAISGFCSHSYSWKFFSASFYRDIKACPCSGFQCQCRTNCRTQCANPILIGIQASPIFHGPLHLIINDSLK